MLTRLESRAALLKVMVDTVPVGIVIAEAPSGRVIHGNAQFETILGRPLVKTETVASWAEWVGYELDGRPLPAQDYPLARALAGEPTNGFVCQVVRPDSSRAWVRVDGAPIRDTEGRLVGGIVSVTDIQNEREASALLEQTVALRTAELAKSRAKIQALFDHAPFDMMVLLVPETGDVLIEDANEAFCQTTGLAGDKIRMQPLDTVLPGDTARMVAADCRTALSGSVECQHTLVFPAGERLVRVSYRALPGDDGGLQRVLLTQTDITEIRRVEVALRQAMRLEVVGQLTGGVAHDFNNLLTAIMGSLELLGRNAGDDRQKRWVRTAMEASQRGATLTQQLLSYARKQFLAPVPTNIPEAIGAMTELIRGSLGARIALVTKFDPQTWPALADPAQLELALINLVVNARDAMERGGTLTLATQNVPRHHAGLPSELEPQASYVQLSVTDSGRGMAPDVAARAMEPFFTTKGIGEGSGLGLSQAYGYARQLGGTLRVTSLPGEGTTVEMFLPRARVAA